MKKDDAVLVEMYEKIQKNTIEEAGWFSRQGARLGAMGGAAKQGLGDVATAMAGKPAAPDAGWRGKYDQGKRENILNTLTKNINNDISKLGLFGKSNSGKQASLGSYGLQQLKGLLDQWLTDVTSRNPNGAPASGSPSGTNTPSGTQPAPAAAAAAPAPAAPEAVPTSAPSSTSAPAGVQSTSAPTSAPAPIPNQSKISDKNGTVYEYDDADSKWYIPSKGGGSLNPIPNDSPEMQKAISNAWNKKAQKAAAAKTAMPTFESFSKYWK